MKATIDIPDELYRQVKAKSALEGRAIREVAAELFERYVRSEEPRSAPAVRRRPGEDPPAWFAIARRYGAQAKRHDWATVSESIAKGWSEEVAELEPGPDRERGE